jgi:hypothetical protein
LNLIADYLYARGTNIAGLMKNGGSYCIRLGIQLHQLFLKNEKSGTSKQRIRKLSECLEEWKADNIRIRDERNSDKRNSGRIKFRIEECVDLFINMYIQFIDRRGYVFLDSNVYKLSNFVYIFKSMFNSKGKQEEKSEREDIFRSCVDVFRCFFEKYYKIQNKSKKIYRNVLCFDHHGELIEYFNRQHSFRKLNEINEEIAKANEKEELELSDDAKKQFRVLPSYRYRFDPNWKYEVYTFYDFLERYNQLSKRLINNGAKFIWYRGMNDSTKFLIPTLYRNINEIPRDSNPIERVSDFQQMYLDQFMARVSESSEINDLRVMGAIDWISCMQHYSAPTNLLDWSENLLIAMYFMLDPLIRLLTKSKIEKSEKDKANETIRTGVSLYLFDPIAYNTLWLDKKGSNCEIIKSIYLSKRMPLPNLSMAYNANQFAAYVLGDPRVKICDRIGKMCATCAFQDPIAILTGQSNPRLKTQAGTFLAFSLYKTGKLDKTSSVESLQEKWLKDKKTPINPFMYKITIKGEEALDEIAKWTSMAGMSTYKVYPDLQNIGLYIKETTEKK